MKIMEKIVSGTSMIQNILDFENGLEVYERGVALCQERLKTLFGESFYVTENLENQYSYCLLAMDEKVQDDLDEAYVGMELI